MRDDPPESLDPSEAETVHELPVPPAEPPPPPIPVRIAVAGTTHVGLVRSNNEDQYLIARLRKSLELLDTSLARDDIPQIADQEGYVLLVADGIGGRAGGERASTLVVQEATHYMLGAAKWFFRLDDPDEHVRLRLLREALERVDRHIIEEGLENPALAGMGTTLTAVSIVGIEAFAVHVGDSRAYRFHDGRLEQLTTDHTLTQEFVDRGLLSPEQARGHRLHNVLTNALGGKPGVDAEIVKLRLSVGDRLLLCTDGLTEMVSDETIAGLLERHEEPAAACRALIDAALAGGGTDNITVIVAAISTTDAAA
jgi:protein phosphatase